MFEYGIIARENIKLNKYKYFTIKATDENNAYEKFMKKYRGWNPFNITILFVSIRKELKDFLKSNDNPVAVEILRSASKTYNEAIEINKMTEAIEITKNILKIILPNCPALKHLIESEPDRIIMSDVKIALKGMKLI